MSYAQEASFDVDLTADDIVLDHFRPERRSRLTLLLALVLVVCLAGGAAIASALLVGGLHSTSKAGASGSSLSADARQAAYEQGRQAGYDQGLAAAKSNKSGAYAKALAKAQRKGYKIGFAAGQDSGRRQGYSAGFQDGSGKYKAAVDAYTKLTKSLQQQAKSVKPAKP